MKKKKLPQICINVHLHVHLKDCLLDFGPIYSFWLFSFERYNRLLSNLSTRKRYIELQIMRRFWTGNIIMNLERPQTHEQFFVHCSQNGWSRSSMVNVNWNRGKEFDWYCKVIILVMYFVMLQLKIVFHYIYWLVFIATLRKLIFCNMRNFEILSLIFKDTNFWKETYFKYYVIIKFSKFSAKYFLHVRV